ncbi:hypothetical protein Taro_013875 [Colocasia esculenta]|uniref:RecA family profile 1 domain-containing protein n=1 Tax=Colocasia esculenta TaxID=4460 RepID=A0A843UNE8_COLES|nr:hypothetical protein [Colocasia esculenta]
MRPQNLLELPGQKCTVGCPLLDALLGGGLPCGSVTEIAGEAGAGKTQLCLQLALCAALPPSHGGLSAASLYIHTEFPFPLPRLRRLALLFPAPAASPSSSSLDHVLVRGVHTAEELLAVLDRLGSVLQRPPSGLPVKLVVVDSIAAIFRSDFDNNAADLRRRSSLFFAIAGRLKEQAARFGHSVVVTNQVVDVVGSDASSSVRVGNYESLWSSGRRVCPALGLSWANCVNSRVFLSRFEERAAKDMDQEEGSCVGAEFGKTRRRMQVVFAPHLPESSCEFVILKRGVLGIQDQGRQEQQASPTSSRRHSWLNKIAKRLPISAGIDASCSLPVAVEATLG